MGAVQKLNDLTDAINHIEAEMLLQPQVEMKLDHLIFGGIYVRTLTIPPLTKLIGRVHKTEHIFTCTRGTLEVFVEDQGWGLVVGPYTGEGKSGTRRLARVVSETEWITYHPTNIVPVDDSYEALLDAVKLIEQEILEPIDNPYIQEEVTV